MGSQENFVVFSEVVRRIFKFDNIQGNSLTHNKELNISVYEFSFGSSHVAVNYTRNSSGDEIANVNFFTTISYTHYKIQ